MSRLRKDKAKNLQSSLNLIWANKPGCSRAVAKIWIANCELSFVLFVDDKSDSLKTEVFPVQSIDPFRIVDFKELDALLGQAKGGLEID